ncbi:MAG: Drug resistance transporter, EmrB/QacA subfamily [Candidatus Levybacteria bacterium GW2011_GWB1_36_18]|nr:MAG: Drug resistance transporter, EmrB/QacA subfamily [Candidatus Levybacteria bacterium GW2011_GWB1_36_18]
MFRKICLIFLAFLLLLAFPTKSFAVTVSITNYPSSISADPFSISVSILGASSGTNYIRVDLYKDGTQNYFGDTYNGSDWYNGSDGKQYYPITIVDSKSTASATLQTRTGVPSVSDYDGQGSYKMRIRRYTSSGGSGSEDPNNTSVAISINIPTPTPTPTSNPTSQTTATPTPTPVKTPTPTPKITTSPTPEPDVISISNQTSSFDQTPTPESRATAVLGESDRSIGIYFILSGGMLLVAGLYFIVKKNKFNFKDKIGI